jgi:hypothetical protein
MATPGPRTDFSSLTTNISIASYDNGCNAPHCIPDFVIIVLSRKHSRPALGRTRRSNLLVASLIATTFVPWFCNFAMADEPANLGAQDNVSAHRVIR